MFSKNYAKYYELFNSDKPYKKEIGFVYKWAGEPKHIFDIGCGTGHYWKYYQNGVHITGVDKSEAMAGSAKNIICEDITKYRHYGRFDCATALFDVLNYIPEHDWWPNIPIDPGCYFIFDLWDKKKIEKEGFKTTIKTVSNVKRMIKPFYYDGKSVSLEIQVYDGDTTFSEHHKMFLYDESDIKKFCGEDFEIIDIKEGRGWQTWYKLIRK